MRCRLSVAISTLVWVATFGGCGGGSPTTPSSPATPTPVPVTRAVVLQGSQAFPADWHYEWWFTTTRAGTLDIMVDWTYADSTVWVRLG